MLKSFTAKFALALVIGLAAAVIIAPVAGLAVARAGFRIPFPRIFDRVVMLALFGVIVYAARALGLVALLREASGVRAREYCERFWDLRSRSW